MDDALIIEPGTVSLQTKTNAIRTDHGLSERAARPYEQLGIGAGSRCFCKAGHEAGRLAEQLGDTTQAESLYAVAGPTLGPQCRIAPGRFSDWECCCFGKGRTDDAVPVLLLRRAICRASSSSDALDDRA